MQHIESQIGAAPNLRDAIKTVGDAGHIGNPIPFQSTTQLNNEPAIAGILDII